MEHGSRRSLHFNVTAHATADWTRQQLREVIPSEHSYRFMIHDRDSIFSAQLDRSIANMGLKVLRTPYRSPWANAFCARMISSMRRQCLDFLIPLSETHLRHSLEEWTTYYNLSRPHSALGPSVPDPPAEIPVQLQSDRHRIDKRIRVMSKPVLGGLYHDYALATARCRFLRGQLFDASGFTARPSPVENLFACGSRPARRCSVP
jgi:hypothetical protein